MDVSISKMLYVSTFVFGVMADAMVFKAERRRFGADGSKKFKILLLSYVLLMMNCKWFKKS